MTPGNQHDGRRLRVEQLEQRIALSAQSWNLAADFAADFAGGLPQNNPNGVWTYLGTDGTTGSLVATNGAGGPPGPSTFGVGAGWAEASGVPSYARGGVFGFPVDSLAGHGPNQIVWTAPAEVDLGGVEITGFFTQATFEPARRMRLQVFKNDQILPLIDVPADFVSQDAIVDLPATQVAMQPGDTLSIQVDGSGEGGNGSDTFSAFDVNVQEIGLAGDYDANAVVDRADHELWVNTFGQMVDPGTGADGNGDGVVDLADYTVWQDHLGASLPAEAPPVAYKPAAIIVETSGVTLPDGSQMDISASQTSGLQEAFDFSAEQGWDIFVMPGEYTLDAHLDIEELQLRTFRFEDVTFEFSPSVTDYGIRFDSTMQVDWYWKGGALQAPSAQTGILFQPRTPHPKDGPKFGTVGVVDSRFQFDAAIQSETYPVTMDTSQAVVNDTTFFFQGVDRNDIQFVSGGFTITNIFSNPRTDDPIPFDLFSTAGRVTVHPPASQFGSSGPGSIATVYLPDGSLLSTAGTTTSGLQEAFDYATLNDLDVVAFGRGVRNENPNTSFGHYTLNDTLVIGDLDQQTVKVYGVTFLYPHVGGTVFEMLDVNASDFELTGEVVGPDADIVVQIKPDTTGINNSTIRIQHPVGTSPQVERTVLIDPSEASIESTNFYFHEVNMGRYGITVSNPAADTYFRNNFLRTVHTHETVDVGVLLGESATNAANIHSNVLQLRTAVTGATAFETWGSDNLINLVAVGGGNVVGARLETSSSNNFLTHGTIHATIPIVDLGTNNTIVGLGVGSDIGLATVSFAESPGSVSARAEAFAAWKADSNQAFEEKESLLLAIIEQSPPNEVAGDGVTSDLGRTSASQQHDTALGELTVANSSLDSLALLPRTF